MFLISVDLVKRKKIIIFITFLLAFFILGQAVLAGEDYGLGDTAKVAFDDDIPFKDEGPAEIIGKIVGAALAFIGILFFILMIYGGFLWMTARGNEQQVEKAKELIIAATIGLIIILAAYAITVYIGEALTTTE